MTLTLVDRDYIVDILTQRKSKSFDTHVVLVSSRDCNIVVVVVVVVVQSSGGWLIS